jgi:hypothetical protein
VNTVTTNTTKRSETKREKGKKEWKWNKGRKRRWMMRKREKKEK